MTRMAIAIRALAAAVLLCGLPALGWPSSAVAADPDTSLERRVKAAFLYQFIPYVEWPPQALGDKDKTIVVAVAGSDETVAELTDVIGGRLALNRPVIVRRWRESDLAGGAHVVYVRRSESQRLPAIARAALATNTLVVSETERGLAQGSMINFEVVDGRVRFDIALPTLEKAGLRISSRLLAVARDVRVQP